MKKNIAQLVGRRMLFPLENHPLISSDINVATAIKHMFGKAKQIRLPMKNIGLSFGLLKGIPFGSSAVFLDTLQLNWRA